MAKFPFERERERKVLPVPGSSYYNCSKRDGLKSGTKFHHAPLYPPTGLPIIKKKQLLAQESESD